MNEQKRYKTNPLVVVLIFLVTAVVVFSTVFLILYLNSDFKEIKANKTEYFVNAGESVELDLTFTNIVTGDYTIESQDSKIAFYNTATKMVDGISGGQVAITINSKTIKNFVPIALTVTVCDGETEATAIMIDSKEDLINVSSSDTMLKKHYKLIKDIDLENEEWVPLGYVITPSDGTNPEKVELIEYSGLFNGNGHTISNAKITTPYETAGLFAIVGKNAVITDLYIKNFAFNLASKDGSKYLCLGAVSGTNYGTIQRTYVLTSSIVNNKTDNCEAYVGGVVGFNTGVVAQTSFEVSELVSMGYAGGISGANVSVKEVLATVKQANVNATVWGTSHVGGIVGIAKGSIISDSFASATAEIFGTSATTYVGGIAGTLQYANVNNNIVNSLMVNCYNVATMSDTGFVGGLVAWNYNYNAQTLQYNKIYGSYYTCEDTGVEIAIYRTQNGEGFVTAEQIATTDLAVVDNLVSYTNSTGDVVLWDFTNIWEMDKNNYPTLKKLTAFSNFDENDVHEEGAIYTAVDLVNISSNLNGNYMLKADIDLSVIDVWNPIGDEANPFNGSFIAETNPATLEFFKISNFKNVEAKENYGLFGCVGQNAKISNVKIENAVIENCSKNIGVLAAINNGTIENCSVSNAVVNLNGNKTNAGLIVAQNNGVITYSSVSNSVITQTATGEYLLGSVAAINTAVIEYSYSNEKTKIEVDTTNENTLIGGLVGLNEETGHVRFSFSKGEFKGYAVGGLVGTNKNYVYESYADNTLTGKYVGGLAYSVSFGNGNQLGSISNCYTLSQLNGVDKHSVKSGFAYVIDYCSEGDNAGKYGLIYHCFSGVLFNEVGDNFFETHSRVRTETTHIMFFGKFDRVAGFIVDCIYDKKGREAEVITQGALVGLFKPITREPAIGLETNECFDVNNFTAQQFSTNIWQFSADYYPELINVVKVAN